MLGKQHALSFNLLGGTAQHGAKAGKTQPESPMFRRTFRMIAKGWFPTAEQRQPGFKAATHILKKGSAGRHIQFQHFGSQFQFDPRIAFRGEALQRATILGKGKVDAVQILQMRRNALATFAGAVIAGAC
jgi:hypothetical protein